jgi:hypothetical protein
MIPKANHNDILLRGWDDYFQAIKQLIEVVDAPSSVVT